jgi:hypothetical protein
MRPKRDGTIDVAVTPGWTGLYREGPLAIPSDLAPEPVVSTAELSFAASGPCAAVPVRLALPVALALPDVEPFARPEVARC